MLGSGVGDGEGSSDVGISTSVLPTLYGPLYEGKPGVGLSCERKDTMMEDLTGKSVYCELRRRVLLDSFMYTDTHVSRNDGTKEDAIDKNPSEFACMMTFSSATSLCRVSSEDRNLPLVFVHQSPDQ